MPPSPSPEPDYDDDEMTDEEGMGLLYGAPTPKRRIPPITKQRQRLLRILGPAVPGTEHILGEEHVTLSKPLTEIWVRALIEQADEWKSNGMTQRLTQAEVHKGLKKAKLVRMKALQAAGEPLPKTLMSDGKPTVMLMPEDVAVFHRMMNAKLKDYIKKQYSAPPSSQSGASSSNAGSSSSVRSRTEPVYKRHSSKRGPLFVITKNLDLLALPLTSLSEPFLNAENTSKSTHFTSSGGQYYVVHHPNSLTKEDLQPRWKALDVVEKAPGSVISDTMALDLLSVRTNLREDRTTFHVKQTPATVVDEETLGVALAKYKTTGQVNAMNTTTGEKGTKSWASVTEQMLPSVQMGCWLFRRKLAEGEYSELLKDALSAFDNDKIITTLKSLSTSPVLAGFYAPDLPPAANIPPPTVLPTPTPQDLLDFIATVVPSFDPELVLMTASATQVWGRSGGSRVLNVMVGSSIQTVGIAEDVGNTSRETVDPAVIITTPGRTHTTHAATPIIAASAIGFLLRSMQAFTVYVRDEEVLPVCGVAVCLVSEEFAASLLLSADEVKRIAGYAYEVVARYPTLPVAAYAKKVLDWWAKKSAPVAAQAAAPAA